MSKVFISHSWVDNEISKKLAEYLKRDGAEIWIDYARISGGESLPDRISKALDWCDTLILVWSKSAANSYYVGLEWQCALSLKKKIIPCLIDTTKLPAILSSYLYIDFKKFEQGFQNLANDLNLLIKEKRQEPILQETKPDPITSPQRFRSQSIFLNENEIRFMIKKYDFFDHFWNKKSHGFANQFEEHIIRGDKIIIDRASGLMWQQGGSSDPISYEKAKRLIEEINQKGYAGYHDWRLPTLEEAMSLTEAEKKNGDLYIDSLFDREQRYIWTSDLLEGKSRAWGVNFITSGYCDFDYFDISRISYVRAVRSLQSLKK